MVSTVCYALPTIQFNTLHLFSHGWSNSSLRFIDWTLSSTTAPSQRGPESNGNERVIYISQDRGLELYHIYQPLRSGRIWHKVNFEAEFNRFELRVFLLTKAEEHSLSSYLLIAGGRIIGFIPFPGVLVLCEMQSVSSRIWTRVAVSISYDDNHNGHLTGLEVYNHMH